MNRVVEREPKERLAVGARSGIALVLLFIAGLAYWWPQVELDQVKQDEAVYLEAATAIAEQQSPYGVRGYFYPPVFAELAFLAVESFGAIGYLRILRGLTVLGAVLAVWFASAWTGWSWKVRAGIALVTLLFSETVKVGLTAGNVSAAAIGVTILGLVLLRQRPLAAGALLGLGIAFKPIAILIPPMLLVSAWLWRDQPSIRALGATVATLLISLLPGVGHLLSLPQAVSGGAAFHPRNLTLSRVLYCFGVEMPSPVLLLIVLFAVGCLFIWRRSGAVEFANLLIVATLLALPFVWIYTMLLALPLQFQAIAKIHREREQGAALVTLSNAPPLLAVLSIFFSHSAGGVETWPLPWQGLVMAVPVLSPAYLWAFCHLRHPSVNPVWQPRQGISARLGFRLADSEAAREVSQHDG